MYIIDRKLECSSTYPTRSLSPPSQCGNLPPSWGVVNDHMFAGDVEEGGADVARVAGCSSRGAGYLRKGPVVGTWNQGGEKERQARPHFYKRSEAYIPSVFIAGPSHVPYRSLRFLMPVIARWVSGTRSHSLTLIITTHSDRSAHHVGCEVEGGRLLYRKQAAAAAAAASVA